MRVYARAYPLRYGVRAPMQWQHLLNYAQCGARCGARVAQAGFRRNFLNNNKILQSILTAVNLVSKLQQLNNFDCSAPGRCRMAHDSKGAQTMTHTPQYGFVPAISIVIANMIGTGVFTSLGFQLLGIRSPFAILMLWALGGVAAFSGAVAYAEMGAALKRSGGEYQFLARIFHPGAGFISGWISASIGFAAPTALAAMTFAAYLTAAIAPDAGYVGKSAIAIALIVALSIVHGGRRRASATLQSVFTAL